IELVRISLGDPVPEFLIVGAHVHDMAAGEVGHQPKIALLLANDLARQTERLLRDSLPVINRQGEVIRSHRLDTAGVVVWVVDKLLGRRDLGRRWRLVTALDQLPARLVATQAAQEQAAQPNKSDRMPHRQLQNAPGFNRLKPGLQRLSVSSNRAGETL